MGKGVGAIGSYLESAPLDLALDFISEPGTPNTKKPKDLSDNPHQQPRIRNDLISISNSQYLPGGSGRGFACLLVRRVTSACGRCVMQSGGERGAAFKGGGGERLRGI
jgi:hypothetical protein